MIQESARTGILQKDKETVALIPEIKFGLMTPDDRKNRSGNTQI